MEGGTADAAGVPAEIFWLALTGLLVIVQLLLAAWSRALAFGIAWAAGPRDSTPGDASVRAQRADRAFRNLMETFPVFAAAAIGVVVAGASSWVTVLGAQIYFVARLAYLPAYVFHVTLLRSVVWAVALTGLLMVLVPLVLAAL